jgi:secreted trypsin-like serine protease
MMKLAFTLFVGVAVAHSQHHHIMGEETMDADTVDISRVRDPRIIGGHPASPGEFPYQIFIENVYNSSEILKCGGALYSAQYVVTAAHCMYFKDTKTWANPKRVWVTAGTNDLTEGVDAPTGDINRDKQIRNVVEIIPHPQFEFKQFPGDLLGYIPVYDIVLLRLGHPLTLSDRVVPIPLAPTGFQLQGNGTVTGWGRQDVNGKWTKQLRKVDIPLVEWQPCAKLFKGYATVTEDMFCTGTKDGGQAPCNGDSGGPVGCKYADDPSGKLYLCGIASWGPSSCPNYSVYTRVSKYYEWVQQEIEARKCPKCHRK